MYVKNVKRSLNTGIAEPLFIQINNATYVLNSPSVAYIYIYIYRHRLL